MELMLLNSTNSSSLISQTEDKADVTTPLWMVTTLNVTSSILFTIGFPTNAIIIYLVSKHRHLRNATNYLVTSLAIADLFVLIFMLFWIIGIKVLSHNLIARLFPALDFFSGTLSMLNVACVSVDRAIAVVCPLQYERIVTKKRSLVIILSIWSYSFVTLIIALIRLRVPDCKAYFQAVLYVGFANILVPVFVILICYVIIFLIVLHKLKGSRKLEKIMSYTRYTFSQETGGKEVSEQKKRRRRKLLREIKVTGNVLLIVVPFTTGWLFFVVTHFYEEFGPVPTIPGHTFNIFMIITPWLLSGLNPIIYLLFNRSLRQTFCETVKKLFKSNDYFLDESRSSILASLSRRASSARTSSTLVEGSELINQPLRNLKKSPSTNSARSSTSVDKSSNEEVVPLSSKV